MQRAEIWGVLAALQGCTRMHVGVDNLNVVRLSLVLLMVGVLESLFLWSMMVTYFLRFSSLSVGEDLVPLLSLSLRVMLMKVW